MGKKVFVLILTSVVLFGCGSYYYFKEAREELNIKKLPARSETPSPTIKDFNAKKR